MTVSPMVFLPEIILALGAIALMLVAAWRGDRAARGLTVCSVFLLLAAIVALFGPASSAGSAFAGQYQADGLAGFVKLFVYLLTAVALMIAPRFFAETGEPMRAEYPVLILLATVGAGIMISAGNFLSLYVGLELQSLASYVLASMMRRDGRAVEAGLKYFVLGALASGMLLYGISLLYGFTGTTDFATMRAALDQLAPMGALFGLTFVFVGLAFKISIVPLHMWTPDVYEGAPTPVTILFATAQKFAAVAMVLRVAMVALAPMVDSWRPIVIFAALASIVLGALGAIGQRNVKRLLAYSSINNMGFALIGLAAATPVGVAAVLGYLAIYTVATLGAFLCALNMRDASGRRTEDLATVAGLSRAKPGLAAALAIFMFSLAGIPPMFGFWAKYLVFDAAVGAGLLPFAVIGILGSVIGAFYYIRIVKQIYFDTPPEGAVDVPLPRIEAILIALCAVLLVAGYAFIPWLDQGTLSAAHALF